MMITPEVHLHAVFFVVYGWKLNSKPINYLKVISEFSGLLTIISDDINILTASQTTKKEKDVLPKH